MIVGIGRKANLFHFGGLRLRLHFLFLLLLVVKEFIVVDYLTNRRIGLRGNFHQVKTLFLCDAHRILSRIYANSHVVSNQPHLRYPDVMINSVFCLSSGSKCSSVETSASRSESASTSFVW